MFHIDKVKKKSEPFSIKPGKKYFGYGVDMYDNMTDSKERKRWLMCFCEHYKIAPKWGLSSDSKRELVARADLVIKKTNRENSIRTMEYITVDIFSDQTFTFVNTTVECTVSIDKDYVSCFSTVDVYADAIGPAKREAYYRLLPDWVKWYWSNDGYAYPTLSTDVKIKYASKDVIAVCDFITKTTEMKWHYRYSHCVELFAWRSGGRYFIRDPTCYEKRVFMWHQQSKLWVPHYTTKYHDVFSSPQKSVDLLKHLNKAPIRHILLAGIYL